MEKGAPKPLRDGSNSRHKPLNLSLRDKFVMQQKYVRSDIRRRAVCPVGRVRTPTVPGMRSYEVSYRRPNQRLAVLSVATSGN